MITHPHHKIIYTDSMDSDASKPKWKEEERNPVIKLIEAKYFGISERNGKLFSKLHQFICDSS